MLQHKVKLRTAVLKDNTFYLEGVEIVKYTRASAPRRISEARIFFFFRKDHTSKIESGADEVKP